MKEYTLITKENAVFIEDLQTTMIIVGKDKDDILIRISFEDDEWAVRDVFGDILGKSDTKYLSKLISDLDITVKTVIDLDS